MLTAFLHGLILSFGLIIPLGPQNMFIFKQGIVSPRASATLPASITASICDSLLIFAAIFGVAEIVLQLPNFKKAMISFGVVFLIVMGYLSWRQAKRQQDQNAPTHYSTKKKILYAATISIFNPHSIVDAVSIIGTSSLHYLGKEKIAFATATIINSWVWFISLAFIGRFLKDFVYIRKYLNYVSAMIMWICASVLTKDLFLEFIK